LALATGAGWGNECDLGQDNVTDDRFEVYGSAHAYFFVVNQIKQHYRAACGLLAGPVERPDGRITDFPKALESCADCVENIVNRITRLYGISNCERVKSGAFRLRVCKEAGIGLGEKALVALKQLFDIWNDMKHSGMKHSGDGEAWKRTVNLATLEFAVNHFDLTTAIVAAYYRLLGEGEQPDWIRRTKREAAEIVLVPLTPPEIGDLLASWEVSVKVPLAPPSGPGP
jgi:hypothetical protein